MKRFFRKATFCWVLSLTAALSACHDDTAALTDGPGNSAKAGPNAKAEQTDEGSLSISSISCALGCCNKKKNNLINNQ